MRTPLCLHVVRAYMVKFFFLLLIGQCSRHLLIIGQQNLQILYTPTCLITDQSYAAYAAWD